MAENTMNDMFKKMMYTGIGLAAVSVDMVGKAVESLAARGEEAVRRGKVMNEELKRKRDAARANVGEVAASLEKLTKEEIQAIKAKICDIQKTLEKAGKGAVLHADAISTRLEEMSKEEIDAIKAKIEEIEKNWMDDGDEGAEG